ncbi:MAG: hypothetical protein ACFFG0_12305, partial [Candidatus Thorarchaeota archaeon]
MIKIENNLLKKIKNFIFNNGRLLERRLFSYFFETGSINEVIKALVAYQNPDGGFGNGIEPDILCPDSTAIGAETTMFYLDLLGYVDNDITDQLFNWIIKNQNEQGCIRHPPKNLYEYPFQVWWDGPDDIRILALSAFLKKWGLGDIDFFKRVKEYFTNNLLSEDLSYYHYPYFLYLKYLGENQGERKMMHNLVTQLPSLFKNNKEHYPLFNRAWYQAQDIVDKKIVENEVKNYFNGLLDDGGLKIIYQNLPWWRPIWTLDGLILLKKSDN